MLSLVPSSPSSLAAPWSKSLLHKFLIFRAKALRRDNSIFTFIGAIVESPGDRQRSRRKGCGKGNHFSPVIKMDKVLCFEFGVCRREFDSFSVTEGSIAAVQQRNRESDSRGAGQRREGSMCCFGAHQVMLLSMTRAHYFLASVVTDRQFVALRSRWPHIEAN